MELLLARTNKEAHAHMDLNPCRCGDPTRPADSAVFNLDGVLASRYSGDLPSLRHAAGVLLPAAGGARPGAAGQVVFGDGTPSELLDPGEWLLLADRYAGSVPAEAVRARPERAARQARRALAHAEAAMGEVLAFVPADGDAVPPEAFRSERGRTVYEAEPGRFSRLRLEVVRARTGRCSPRSTRS